MRLLSFVNVGDEGWPRARHRAVDIGERIRSARLRRDTRDIRQLYLLNLGRRLGLLQLFLKFVVPLFDLSSYGIFVGLCTLLLPMPLVRFG